MRDRREFPGGRSPRRRSVEPGRPASSTAADTPETFLVSGKGELPRLSAQRCRSPSSDRASQAGGGSLTTRPRFRPRCGAAATASPKFPKTPRPRALQRRATRCSALAARWERRLSGTLTALAWDAVSARSALKFAGERQAGVCTSTPPRRNPDLRLLRDSPEVVLASAALLDRSTFSNYLSCSSCCPPVQ